MAHRRVWEGTGGEKPLSWHLDGEQQSATRDKLSTAVQHDSEQTTTWIVDKKAEILPA